MNAPLLILYTRSGCCLCEGLEQRLKDIPLQDLSPPMNLEVIDIDRSDLSTSEMKNYDLRVPVMVLFFKESNLRIEIPRVSPRIKQKELFQWLQKVITKLVVLN